MNPPCAKCKKTVYPMEKFNCLDKIWHKSCFRCEACDLKLTMNTYKGYNKLPYCKPHYPTTKFTAVADTPEAIRLAKQQKNISEVEYRKDKMEHFKEFTQVADTVSNQTASKAYKLASTVGYHAAPHEVGHENEGRPPAEQIVNARQVPGGAITQQRAAPPQSQEPPPTKATPPKPVYVAVYSYPAADDDELTINEGDRLTDVETIDEGWMEGTNSRTGKKGMFPSNYVQPV